MNPRGPRPQMEEEGPRPLLRNPLHHPHFPRHRRRRLCRFQ